MHGRRLENGHRDLPTTFIDLIILHAFAYVPVDKSILQIHQVELVVYAIEDLGDGSGKKSRAFNTHHFRKITIMHNNRWLIIDATLMRIALHIRGRGLETDIVISSTDNCSRWAFYTAMFGA